MSIKKERLWTDKDDNKLIQMRQNDFPYNHIATTLNRTNDACRTRYKKIGKQRSLRGDSCNTSDNIEISGTSKSWTEEQLEILWELRRNATPYKLIALELGRTIESCSSKYSSTIWSQKPYVQRSSLKLKTHHAKNSKIREAIARSLERRLDKQHIAAEIISDTIREVVVPYSKVDSPVYKPRKKESSGDEEVVLVLSDIHIGAYHTLEETGGLSEFNEDILARRMMNLMYAIRDIYEIHSKLYKLPAMHIVCLGDVVAGDNASGEWSQNYINMVITDQVFKGYRIISDMIKYWLGMFPKVKFYGVRGNHGRISSRGIEKDHVNWDVVCYNFLERVFENNDQVEFVCPKSWWIMEKIKGHNFLMVHGEDIKSKSMPIKGLLDFQKEMSGIVREFPDYTLAGHFHNSAELTTNHGRVIINGSVVGSDIYALKDVHAKSSPEQTVFGVHNKHGMTWKYNINLDHDRDPS